MIVNYLRICLSNCHVYHVTYTPTCPCNGFKPQSLFAEQSNEGAEHIIATTQSALQKDEPEDRGRPHTLKEFAIDHFRPPPKRTLSRSLSRGAFRRKDSYELWAFSRVSGLGLRFSGWLGVNAGVYAYLRGEWLGVKDLFRWAARVFKALAGWVVHWISGN